MQPLLANYGSAAPGQAIYMTPEGSSVQEGSISTASAPAPLPRSEKGRRRQADAEQAQQAASSSFATARVVQPAQRREEDAGVRVDVPVEDDLDDSMTLPPAYNDIRHSSGGPAISLDRLVLQPIPSRQE
ncbi:hypothetical protein PsYK624_035830 [Phanerochaete sordida]|uniref:Uncharacterized protein n=1 Tax=Phanerochaete sordida TaxID=48140 RepID=A0A9P3G434_9APHY|nr:hypothetical protein PsYK624_035830 [Phanerochaete sordida]